MDSLWFVALVWIIYEAIGEIRDFIKADVYKWESYVYQEERLQAVEKAIQNREKYVESLLDVKMHKRFSYKYDPWYEEYIETGILDIEKAKTWIRDHLHYKIKPL